MLGERGRLDRSKAVRAGRRDQRALRPRRRSAAPRRDLDRRPAPAGRDHQVPAARARRSSSSTSRRACSRRPRASSCSPCCARSCVEEHRAVALVSHKLDEILHATDEVTIMRGGRVVDRRSPADATAVVAGPVDGRPRRCRCAREAAALGLDRDGRRGTVDRRRRCRRSQAPVGARRPRRERHDARRDGVAARRPVDRRCAPARSSALAGVEGNGQRDARRPAVQPRPARPRRRCTSTGTRGRAPASPARWPRPASA